MKGPGTISGFFYNLDVNPKPMKIFICSTILIFQFFNAALNAQPIVSVSGLTILNCYNQQTTLTATSSSNVSFNWHCNFPPINLSSPTIQVNISSNPNASVAAVYTLTANDLINQTTTSTVITIYQNTYKPNTVISSGTVFPKVTCKTPTIVLANSSITGIPPGGYSTNLPVSVFLWEPSWEFPETGNTYVAGVPGVYTLTAVDQNNGCKSTGTLEVVDGRVYPNLVFMNNNPELLPCPGTVTLTSLILNSNSPNYTYSWTAPGNAIVTTLNQSSLVTATPGTYSVIVQDQQNGCSRSVSIDVWACVGLKETNSDEHFRIYPNPAVDFLKIKTAISSSFIEATIITTLGKIIRKETFTNNEDSLNLKDLPPGIYFLDLRDSQNKALLKFIKE